MLLVLFKEKKIPEW